MTNQINARQRPDIEILDIFSSGKQGWIYAKLRVKKNNNRYKIIKVKSGDDINDTWYLSKVHYGTYRNEPHIIVTHKSSGKRFYKQK